MFKRWLLALIAHVGIIVLGLCCCVSLVYLLACKPVSYSGRQSAPWSGGTPTKEGYMAVLQEREDSHRHYINSLTKQIAQLKEALQERTLQLQESLDKAKTRGILPRGLESLHRSPTQADLKVETLASECASSSLGLHSSFLPSGVLPLPVEPSRGKRGREAVQRV